LRYNWLKPVTLIQFYWLKPVAVKPIRRTGLSQPYRLVKT
jgi:hypothetical protein